MKLKKLFIGLFLVTAVAVGCVSVVEEAFASSTAVVVVKESNYHSVEIDVASCNSCNKVGYRIVKAFSFDFKNTPEFSPVNISPPRASP